jgi:SAM-dependent methyltransferase
MTMSRVDQRTPEQLREHYEVEKELATRLRNASKIERRSLYNVVYDERAQRIPHHPLVTQAADPEIRARAIAPQLRLLNSFLTPETVFLEVGPGDCALALEVAKHVRHVYAVDVSEELVIDAARPSNFELFLSDGIHVPVPANAVDLAYSNQLMEHLHPDDAIDQLRGIFHALVPGGMYICITPNRLSGPYDISRHFDEVATGFHLKEYTITELEAAFKAAGFSKVRAFVSYGGRVLTPELPPYVFSAIEWALENIPRKLRKKIAHLLTAVKVIAIK